MLRYKKINLFYNATASCDNCGHVKEFIGITYDALQHLKCPLCLEEYAWSDYKREHPNAVRNESLDYLPF